MMKVLLLGPECSSIEKAVIAEGHQLIRHDGPFDLLWLEQNNPDFAISYRYKNIIRNAELKWFSNNLINLHISLLPWNRGADPNLWGWLENTPKGVSIHIINDGIDTGPVLLQQSVSMVAKEHTLKTSYEKLSKTIESLLIDNLSKILEGKIQPQNQNKGGNFHHSLDKARFLPLLEDLWWDTPASLLEGYASMGGGGKSSAYLLRPVQAEDTRAVWQIANDPAVRQWAFQPDPIPWADHQGWMARQRDAAHPFFVAEDERGRVAGYVRFAPDQAGAYTLSIGLGESLRGRGLGAAILRQACALFCAEYEGTAILAWVKVTNIASMIAFLKAGFVPDRIDDIGDVKSLVLRQR